MINKAIIYVALATLSYQGTIQIVTLSLPIFLSDSDVVTAVEYFNIVNIIIALLCFGFNSLVVRDVAIENNPKGNLGPFIYYLSLVIGIGSLIGILLVPLFIFSNLSWVYFVLYLSSFLTSISRMFYAYLNGNQKYQLLTKLGILYLLLNIIYFPFMFYMGITGWIVARVIAEFCFLLLLLCTINFKSLAKIIKDQKVILFTNIKLLKLRLREGAQSMGAILTNRVVFSIEYFILAYLYDNNNEILVLFSIILILVNVLLATPAIFSIYLLPIISLRKNNDTIKRKIIIGFILNILISVTVLSAIFFIDSILMIERFNKVKEYWFIPVGFASIYFIEVYYGTLAVAFKKIYYSLYVNLISIFISTLLFVTINYFYIYGLEAALYSLMITVIIRISIFKWSLRNVL